MPKPLCLLAVAACLGAGAGPSEPAAVPAPRPARAATADDASPTCDPKTIYLRGACGLQIAVPQRSC